MNTSERRFRETFLATAAAAPDLAPVLDEHLESDRSHLHSYHTSIWIPMTQSIVTAFLFGLDDIPPGVQIVPALSECKCGARFFTTSGRKNCYICRTWRGKKKESRL